MISDGNWSLFMWTMGFVSGAMLGGAAGWLLRESRLSARCMDLLTEAHGVPVEALIAAYKAIAPAAGG